MNFSFKTPCALIFFLGEMLCLSADMPKPFFEFNFNSTDQSIALHGHADVSRNGDGLSGKFGDRALVVAPYSETGTYVDISGSNTRYVDSLNEVTITAWYRANDFLNDAATLFDAYRLVLIWDGKKEQWVWRVDAESIDGGPGNNKFYLGSNVDWVPQNDWVFVALVWDRESGEARIYNGSLQDEATMVKSVVNDIPVNPLSRLDGYTATLGGNARHADRTFHGSIDNVRFFDVAMGLEDIEQIRLADRKNYVIEYDW